MSCSSLERNWVSFPATYKRRPRFFGLGLECGLALSFMWLGGWGSVNFPPGDPLVQGPHDGTPPGVSQAFTEKDNG
jgi:hypothetical protein